MIIATRPWATWPCIKYEIIVYCSGNKFNFVVCCLLMKVRGLINWTGRHSRLSRMFAMLVYIFRRRHISVHAECRQTYLHIRAVWSRCENSHSAHFILVSNVSWFGEGREVGGGDRVEICCWVWLCRHVHNGGDCVLGATSYLMTAEAI